MILIADGGSTKSSWGLIDNPNSPVFFNTEGYNPYFVDTATIIASLNEQLPDNLDRAAVTEVYYYGAGCSVSEKVEIVSKAMEAVFRKAKVMVSHDLLAAARALLGRDAGFAAILGTGTNTCFYDGKEVSLNIDSLGYFLGDEGSGSFIGKRLLRDFMRGYLPEQMSKNFKDTYNLSNEDIFNHIYNKPLPNRFLASFSKFVYDNNNFSYSREIVKDGFQTFFKNLVTHYPDYDKYSFNCIGSVGYNFRDVLSEVCNENNMKVGKILRAPIDDLVYFHTHLMK
jgi:glucosamine kinase